MDANSIARFFYNIVSPVYDLFFGARTRHVQDMRKRIVERLGLRKGDRVLEIGVGTGANLPYLYEKVGPQGQIHGIDISEGMLDRCRRNLGKEGIKAGLVLGNAENLPYEDDVFDAVLHFGSINFIQDKKKALSEAVRVAKPGTRIVVGDEAFPLIGTPEAIRRLLPGNIEGVRQGMERVLVRFWILEFRKKRGRK